MPTTVRELFAAAGLEPAGLVRWGEPIPSPVGDETGVYVVSLGADPTSLDAGLTTCPLDTVALSELLTRCPALTLDGAPSDVDALADRLRGFWFPDEVVLYAGLAGQLLRTRVRQYYKTPLGAKRPHKGGWWFKTLSVLSELTVHFAPVGGFAQAEQQMLRAFAVGVSEESRSRLHDQVRVMPFANLEFPPGTRKAHGIRGATPGEATPTKPKTTAPPPMASSRPATRATAGDTSRLGGGRTQRVTAKDIEAGRIRIPQDGTKRLFPREKSEVALQVRGTELQARWDPRYGADRERSGILSVGRGRLDGLIEPDEALTVRAGASGLSLD